MIFLLYVFCFFVGVDFLGCIYGFLKQRLDGRTCLKDSDELLGYRLMNSGNRCVCRGGGIAIAIAAARKRKQQRDAKQQSENVFTSKKS